MKLPLPRVSISLIALVITSAATLFNCVLQGAIFLVPDPPTTPPQIHMRERSGAWTTAVRTIAERHFYFSYERYVFPREKNFVRKEIASFFIPTIESFAYYNAEGRRFALFEATDAETKEKYSCWLDRRFPEASLIIEDGCAIEAETRLRYAKIIFLRPMGVMEKLRTLKKELYG